MTSDATVPRLEPFVVDIPDAVLDDLRRRLRATKLAPDFANDDWDYGTTETYLAELVAYWADGFDWRAQERAINAWPHFRVEIDDVPIHFIHARGKGPSPIPIVLTHGWPWTFWDFKDVIGPLTDPAAHGGDPADAFDVVVTSLPGFAFSSPLRRAVSAWETADLWVTLMQDVLGYERFAAHGSDWGCSVTNQLGHKYADRLIGVHVTTPFPMHMFNRERPWDVLGPLVGVPDDLRAELLAWERPNVAHMAAQIIRPQTISHALHDSPAGLCSWILERRREWSDCGGDIESVFSKDEILTLMTLYWATETFVTTARYYRESCNSWEPAHDRSPVVEAPSGVSSFTAEGVPEAVAGDDASGWMQDYYNLVFERTRASGGHFAAAENPVAVVEDIREMFRTLR